MVQDFSSFSYTVETAKSVEQAIEAVDNALKERKFSVLWHLDMREKLEEKGISGGPEFHVLEVCSAPRAKQALDAQLEVGYFLPCKMVVYRKDEKTHIGVLKPTMLMSFIPGGDLDGLAHEVEQILVEAAEAAR